MHHTSKTPVMVISRISAHYPTKAAALVIIHGEELGRKFDLCEPRIVIGRSADAGIQVDHDAVSRRHAALTITSDGWVLLEDLGSTNGTYVNDVLIADEQQLRNGDLVKIGRSIFKFIASNNIEAAYHDEVYRLTTTDGLTQTFNRRYLEEALDREFSRCRRHGRALSLVMLDLDHFKLVNDTWGHLAGDAVLKGIASLVRSRVRREDVVARFGGEEFAVLLPEVELRGALALAEKMRELIATHPIVFDDDAIPVTVSAGAATLSRSLSRTGDLIRRADEKLYEAKGAGRNCVRG
jgi:two-component system cell cycle response regulator